MVSGAALTSSFCNAYRGAAAAADDALEAALRDFSARGQSAWPDVPLEAAALAAYLGERAPEDVAPVAWLGELDARDLFLACACVEGVPQAVRAFDAAFLDDVGVYLRVLNPPPWIVAETKQLVLEKIFVGSPGKPPKIRQYRGHGALRGWVRITAVRAALTLQEVDRAGPWHDHDEADALAGAVVSPDADPELALLRASYHDDFLAALRAAIAGLSRRDRGLLRFVFIDRLTPAQIGAMYGVHRTTVMRWIEVAQKGILAQTRARMMEHLRLSPSECDHIFVLVKSRMNITLNALLETGR